MVPEFVSPDAAGSADRGPAADLLRRGQGAARRGDRPRARRLLRATLIADPTNAEARLWLAALVEDPREAVQLLSEVLQAHPGHVRAAAGLRWAWERLEAQAAARCTTPPPVRLRLQPLPEVAKPPHDTGLSLARLATAVACLAGALATVLAVSCSPAQTGPAAQYPVASVVEAAAFVPTPAAEEITTLVAQAEPAALPTDTPAPTAAPAPTATPVPEWWPGEAGKWIEVDLGRQTVIAWEGDVAVRQMAASTGTALTPTVTGRYPIYLKVTSQTMSGPGYSIPNVPHILYFFRGYALHGAYWHTNFGTPQSHGCVNLPLEDAAWLFAWAGPQLPPGAFNVYASADNPGTLVVVHP